MKPITFQLGNDYYNSKGEDGAEAFIEMYLTREEENILDGEKNEILERMFRLLVRLGDIYDADKMIPVGSVQVAGVSYNLVATNLMIMIRHRQLSYYPMECLRK